MLVVVVDPNQLVPSVVCELELSQLLFSSTEMQLHTFSSITQCAFWSFAISKQGRPWTTIGNVLSHTGSNLPYVCSSIGIVIYSIQPNPILDLSILLLGVLITLQC